MGVFLSKCYYCENRLLMVTKGKRLKSYACSKCVPKNSAARDGINESYDYEFAALPKRGRC